MKIKTFILTFLMMSCSFMFGQGTDTGTAKSESQLKQYLFNDDYGTIIIGSDITVSSTIEIPQGRKITIDLNGNKLSTNNEIYIFRNFGRLTIKDSNSNGGGTISTLGIYNGKPQTRTSTDDINYSAQLTIEGGVFNNIAENGGAAIYNYLGVVNIKGGKFYGEYSGITNYGVATIKNAYIECLNRDNGAAAIINDFEIEFGENVEIVGRYTTVSETGVIIESDYEPTYLFAELNGVKYESLQKALNACTTGNNTINLLFHNSAYATVNQKEGVNITIDGNGYKEKQFEYSGTIYVNGDSRNTGAETLTIQDVNFVTTDNTRDFISCNNANYAHNVTVKNCNFTATEDSESVVAMRFRQSYNINVVDGTFTNLHSAMWATGGSNITVDNITADCKEGGLSLGTATPVVVKNSTIKGGQYGVRADGSGNYSLNIEGSKLTAAAPVIVRNTTAEYNLTVKNDVELNATENGPQVVVTAGKDDAAYEVPTSDVNVTLYDNVTSTFGLTAKIGNNFYATLQDAIDNAKNNETILLLADNCKEDVTVTQAENYAITIDGAEKTFKGTITVDGKSARYETTALTIKNVKFDATEGIEYDACINLGVSGNNNTRYTNHVTVENCTFTDDDYSAVAIKSYTGGDKNLVVKGCTATKMHSLAQLDNVEEGLEISGNTANTKNGLNLGSSGSVGKVNISNNEISVNGYAVRIGASSGGDSGNIVLTGNTLKTDNSEGDAVIIVRGAAITNVDLDMTSNVVSGTTHISGNTAATNISADANYWDGNEIPVSTTPIDVLSYYAELNADGTINEESLMSNVVAEIGEAQYTTLQNAINAVKNDETITLVVDCAETVHINKSNVAFTIDGKISDTEKVTYSGVIGINIGQNVTIRNIDFATSVEANHDFIKNEGSSTGKNYNTTLMVENCSFTGNLDYDVVAVRTTHPTHTQIVNCTGAQLHSLLQNTGGQKVTVKKVVLTDSKSGLALGGVRSAVIENNEITANKYAVRVDAGTKDATIEISNNKFNAYIPVIARKATAENVNFTFSGKNTMTSNEDGVWFVIDGANNGYEDGEISLEKLTPSTGKVFATLEDENLNPAGIYGVVAKIGKKCYPTLQAAVNAATNNDIITLLANITEDITISQVEGKNIVIDGKKAENENYKFDGTIYVYGNSRNTGAETLTIQNINFYTEKQSHDFISCNDGSNEDIRYAHNVTVKNCNFATSAENTDNSIVGMRFRQVYDIAVENCTSNYIFSLMWSTSVEGLAIDKVTVNNCKEGLSVGGASKNVVISNSEINSPSFGIRASVEGGQFTMTNSKVNALVPVVVRNENGITDLTKYALSFTFDGENTIVENNPTDYWFVAGETEYKGGSTEMPTAPNGYVYVTLNDTGLNSNGIYGSALSGKGTEAEPYLIKNVNDLVFFRDQVNAGKPKYSANGVHVALAANIDMASVANWTPIGDVKYDKKYVPVDADKVFKGTFNGNNKVISNLKIEKIIGNGTNPNEDANVGLFGITGEGAVIKNLTLTNVNIKTSGRNVGALAGFAYKATLENITVNGDIQIKGGNNVSGVAGMTRHYDMSATNITVSGKDGSTIVGNNIVGGIFAEIAPNGSTQTFKNLSIENVAITGVGGVGGIVGLLTQGSVESVSVKNVALTGKTDYQGNAMGRIRLGSVAGLMGDAYATITSPTIENVTAKNLDGNAVVLPIIGANYDASSNATEAHIGDTYYATFKGAINAAQEGNTIKLLSDINTTEAIAIAKGLTIDGDNKTITSSARRVFELNKSNIEVTMKNLNMVSTAERVEYNDIRGVNIVPQINGVILTLTNCSVDFTHESASDWSYAVNQTNNGEGNGNTITINGGTYEGANVVNVWGKNHTVTIDGATLNSIYGYNQQYVGVCVKLAADSSVPGGNVNLTVKNSTFNGNHAMAFEDASATDDVVVMENNTDNTRYYVALVADQKYYSVSEAINAAEDGATVQLLPFIINEYVYPWQESNHSKEKSITIVGSKDAEGNLTTTMTGGMYLGYDDSQCREHTIVVKDINFTGKGLKVACQKNVTIEGNTFTNIEDSRAIAVIGKDIEAIVKNNTINGVKIGVELRNMASAIVENNTIKNTGHNSVQVTAANQDANITIKGNTLENWATSEAGNYEGRAIRISGGNEIVVTENTMILPEDSNAKEGFVKITKVENQTTEQSINASANYWNGVSPLTAGIFTGVEGDLVPVLVSYYTDVEKKNLVTLSSSVAKIDNVYYQTFEAALNAVQNGETITLLNIESESELKKEIEFKEAITFTITGTAPKYALPVVTFQNAKVNIKDAEIFIPELDARQNATINVINSTVHDAGGNGIVKSYYNGAINIDATSTVYTMQVTTMGYINVAGTLNATWQTNVYGNGLITLNQGAKFNTAALHLTAQDYSGRDNTDAERVGKPAEIVVDGANFTVGKVYSDSGADYSYNSSKGINVGTVEGKSAILNIKNGGNVNIYMANGETTNFGAGATVNVNASTLNTICRSAEGEVTLANAGTVYVTGEANLNIAKLTGNAINFTDVTIADAYIGGAVNAFGTNNINGTTTISGILSVGYNNASGAPVVVNINGNFNGGNVLVGSTNEHVLNLGNAEGERTTAHFGQLGAFGDVNINNADVTYGYTFVRNDFNVTNSALAIKDGANTYFAGNAKVVLDNSTWNLTGYANIGSYGGYMYGNADVTLKNGSSMTATNLGVEVSGTNVVKVTLEDSSSLTATKLTNQGSIVLAGEDAKVTSNKLTANEPTTTVAYHKVNYVDGSYVVVDKDYVAQIIDAEGNSSLDRRYESFAEAAKAALNGETIELLWTEGHAPISMAASFFGKNVTITGTATVDWSKNWFFVGRGGEGNATVTFDNANLTSASGDSNSGLGIHVSGREKNTNNKYDGTLVIKNSTIELDYLIDRGAITIDNATLTVKKGFGIAGRPASETESGENATATISLAYGAKLIVNNHNGMGVGQAAAQLEGLGIMNIDATSTFETTQAFNISANGTMNNAGIVNITGALTNNGTINFTSDGATLATTTEGLTINYNLNQDKKVVYKEGKYQVVDKAYVAQIDNGNKYESLQEAIEAVADNGTVTLIENETFTEDNRFENGNWYEGVYYVGDKSFTIDLNEHTIGQDGSVNDYLLLFKNEGSKDNTITLKNGTIDAGTAAYCALATASSNAKKITINTEDINFVGNNSNGAVLKIRGGTELNVNEGTIITGKDNYVGIEAAGDATVVNIYAGTKIYQAGTTSYVGSLVGASYNATVNVYGGEGTSAKGGFIVMTSGGTINVSGGEWTANTDGTLATDNNAVLIAQIDKTTYPTAEKSIINVTGGTFKGGYHRTEVDDAQINISGGNFNADPTNYLEEYYIVKEENDGTFSVVEDQVAKIGDVTYKSLQEAFDAAQEGDVIVVLKNIDLKSGITVAADDNMTLDLNGMTISMQDASGKAAYAITNNGNLTIKDSAEVDGKITFNSTTPDNSFGYATSTIGNGGILTIDGGVIENTTVGGASYAIDGIWHISEASLTINDGTITANKIAVRQVPFSATAKNTVTINGGTLTGETAGLQMFNINSDAKLSETIIKGGTFNGTYGFYTSFTSAQASKLATINIDGGEFNGYVYLYNGHNGSNEYQMTVAITDGLFNSGAYIYTKDANGNDVDIKAITGGIFKTDPSDYVAENYGAFPYDENSWTVRMVSGEQEFTLTAGWNWMSSYITDFNGADGLNMLANSLGENGVQIKNNLGSYTNSASYGWYGSLTSVSVKEMYLVNVIADQKIEFTGNYVNYDECEIILRPGWNYIGYPVNEEMNVIDALARLEASSDDWIKTQGSSASYSWGAWRGELTTLTPGCGYMYYNASNANKSLYYSTKSTTTTSNNRNMNYWTVDATQYPSNMTMIATVDVEGGNYEVAAFINGEVRGSARPIYVEEIDSYILVLTISGDDVEEMTFKYYDIATGEEIELSNRMNYSDNAIVGSADEPYMLTRGTTGIGEDSLNEISIYPNPTTTGTKINLQATCDKVEVFNALGVKVAEYQNVDSIDAIETAGIYVIRITNDSNVQNCRLVVK